MMAWPAPTRCTPSRVSTCNSPRKTTVYSSNSGVCPGSLQADGLVILAILMPEVVVFTRPTNSSIIFGGLPAAGNVFSFLINFVIFFQLPRKKTECKRHSSTDDPGRADFSLVTQSETATTSASVLIDQVKIELQTTANSRRRSLQNIWTLVVTLVLFLGLGLLQQSLSGILIVIVVLLIHETGHFTGMKMFGYRDVQMFFIPFFGAAVSGSEKNASSMQKAIVCLLGPIPGLVLGISSAILFYKTKDEFYSSAASSFLFINGFNLLPFHPLDGGRFLDCVLLSRNPKIEITFKVITGLALAGIAFALRDAFLSSFAVFALFSLKGTTLAANAARQVRARSQPSDLS